MVDTPFDQRQLIDFPGRHEDEEFQFYFRQHWIRLWTPFWHLLLWTALFIAGIFAIQSALVGANSPTTRHVFLILLSVFFLITQLGFLARFYTYFLYVIIISDKKVHRIKKTMLIVNDHQSIDLWTLEDITKNQHGIIQNILGFGTLVLVMQGQDALRIHFTPSINQKHEIIMKLREQARHRLLPQQQMVEQVMQTEKGSG